MIRMYDMAFYFLFPFSLFFWRFFFVFGLDQHVIGRKLRGRVRVCRNYSSCMMSTGASKMADGNISRRSDEMRTEVITQQGM